MVLDEILSDALKAATAANEIIMKNKDSSHYNYGQHDLYKASVDMMCSIRNHAVKGVFPDELFKHRSPNQTDDEAKYIKNNYKQVTLPLFMDYVNTINRPFGDGNWSIHYEEDANKYKQNGLSFKEYVEGKIPVYGNLEFFIKNIVPSTKTIDANGYMAVRPKEIDYMEDEEGIFVIDPSQLTEPSIFYFDSANVIDYEEGEYYLFKSCEHSVVIDSYDRPSETGTIFELYTKFGIYFLVQVGKKRDNKFSIELFFETTDIPVIQLKGIPTIKEESILWQSPFLYATDLLDLVAVNSNWLQASINKCVFPNVVMYGSPCDFRDTEGNICDGGIIRNGELGKEKTCTACSGSGLKSRLSPLGTLLLQPQTKFAEGEAKSTQDPLKFVSPDVTTLEFQMKKISDDEAKAKAILHLRNKNSSTKTVGDVTATEVFDDAKGMTAFVKPISDQIFNIYDFFLEQIGKQRYGEEFKKPTLVYPKSFDFKTPEDYLLDLSNAIKNNLHPALIELIILQYVSAYYADSVSTTKVFTLIANSDRLFGLSMSDINMQLAKGVVSKWEVILHTSILVFINELEREDNTFLQKELQVQIEMLIQRAKDTEANISESSDLYNSLLPPATT